MAIVNKTTKTSPADLKAINKLFESLEDNLVNAYGRWKEESMYEDIKSYSAFFSTTIKNAGGTFLKMTSRPFGFHFSFRNKLNYRFFTNGKSVSWKRA